LLGELDTAGVAGELVSLCAVNSTLPALPVTRTDGRVEFTAGDESRVEFTGRGRTG
jgi:hypothetical protein